MRQIKYSIKPAKYILCLISLIGYLGQMILKKSLPLISFEDFITKASTTREFVSWPKLKRYEVTKIVGNVMHFIRKDTNEKTPWSFDLTNVYEAYCDLEDFKTEAFRKIRYSSSFTCQRPF